MLKWYEVKWEGYQEGQEDKRTRIKTDVLFDVYEEAKSIIIG
jgi:hypothetical protein